MDKFTKEFVSNTIIKNFDDGVTIFLDWNKIENPEDLNKLVLSGFNIVNVPYESLYKVEKNNYYISFFSSNKSSTGYIASLINRDKNIYKTERYNRNNF